MKTNDLEIYHFTSRLSWTVCHNIISPPRMYHAEKLPETNLVFIIADAQGTCTSCSSRPLVQDEQQCIL